MTAVSALLAALRRRWYIVVAATILAAVLAAGSVEFSRTRTPEYQSEASLLLIGSKYQVKLDSKITTVDNVGNLAAAAQTARADEYRAVAQGTDVRSLANRLLRDLLPADAPETALPGGVEIRVRGAMITVSATAMSPETAMRLADAYLTALGTQLDDVYGETDTDRATLEREARAANERYQKAEIDLLTYRQTSDLQRLQYLLKLKQGLFTTLSTQQNNSIQNQVASRYQALVTLDQIRDEADGLRILLERSGQSPAGLVATSVALVRLQERYAEALRLPDKERYAEALRLQERYAEALRLPDKEPVTGAPGTSPIPKSDQQFIINGETLLRTGVSRTQLLADTTALISAVDVRRPLLMESIQQRIDSGSGSGPATLPVDPMAYEAVVKLLREMADLDAQLRTTQLQEESLARNIMNTQTTKEQLETKLQESTIALSTGGGKAVVLSRASVPESRGYSAPLANVILTASLVGLLVGLLGVVLLEYLRPRTRRSAEPGLVS